MPKLLKEKYKTYEGARKRAAFENGVAKSEYERGIKSKHYHYGTVLEGTLGASWWRIERTERPKEERT